jgi:5'-nucleotidase
LTLIYGRGGAGIIWRTRAGLAGKTYQGLTRDMKQSRAWQRMLSGRRLDLLDPTPLDVEIEDIAHGLAFVARWNGQTLGDFAYSVAEHSLLVEELFGRIAPAASARWRLAALLHDAPEYVIGDMISPVKAAVGPGYGALDDRLMAAIHLRFGLPAVIPVRIKRQIKKADRISAWMEATQIAGFSNTEADKLFGKPDKSVLAGLAITLRPPVEVRAAFTRRHAWLLSRMG